MTYSEERMMQCDCKICMVDRSRSFKLQMLQHGLNVYLFLLPDASTSRAAMFSFALKTHPPFATIGLYVDFLLATYCTVLAPLLASNTHVFQDRRGDKIVM